MLKENSLALLAVRIHAVAEHLGRTRLVEVRPRTVLAQGFEHVHRAQRVGLHRELRNLKADSHMALRREVVDLVWLDLVQDAVDRRDVEHVSILVVQTVSDVLQARLLMLGDRVAPDQPVDLVAERQQVLCEVGAVLPGDAGNQRSLCHLCRAFSAWGI